MPDTLTPNIGLVKPAVGEEAGRDQWGDKTNSNWDKVDTEVTKRLVDAPNDGGQYVRQNSAWAPVSWTSMSGKPTTISGYGITDAYTKTEVNSTFVDVAGDTMTGKLTLPASTTTSAGLNIGNGSSPTSPVNGDLWLSGSALAARIGGTTYTAALANASNSFSSTNTFTGTTVLDGVGLRITQRGTNNASNSTLTLFTKSASASDTVGSSSTSKGWTLEGRSDAFATTSAQNDLVISYWDSAAWNVALTFDAPTRVATFSQRPVFGTATPWDSANLSSTTQLAEGTNLYFTTSRAAAAAPVQEAPTDSKNYVRSNSAWVVAPVFVDAPTDGALYGRSASAWVAGVKLAGDTMTGNLTVKTSAWTAINVDGGATQGANVQYLKSGKLRWTTQLNSDAESGSNAGSNFSIYRADDAGNVIGGPAVLINRATGVSTFGGEVAINKVTPVLSLNKTATTGQDNLIYGQTNGKNRWLLDLGDSVNEAGSNVGSDFDIYRYADDGSYLGNPVKISRATGSVTVNSGLVSTSGAIDVYGWGGNNGQGLVALNSARTAYVYWDGSNYSMPTGNLNVNGNFVWHNGLTGYGLNGSVGAASYIKFYNGFVLQWGYNNPGAADVTQGFAIACNVLAVMVCPAQTPGASVMWSIHANAPSTTGVTINTRRFASGSVQNSAGPYYWAVFGYV